MQSIPLTIKRAFWLIFLCLAIASFPLPSLAVTVQDLPNPRQVYRGWVTDTANILSPETQATLDQMISKLEAENGTEIAVVTVPDTAPSATPKQFATQLFKYWGIGKKGIDNGVLFLISKDDRRVEIETGYGIEKILPNARVGDIINEEIIPRFKQDDFAGGTLAGIQALVMALEGRTETSTVAVAIIALAIFALIVTLLVIGIFGETIVYPNTADSYCDDGGNSVDGGSFGGGDSGGGGDGGSW
jgi:uncharacterized protein